MKPAKHRPPMISPTLNTAASSDTPTSPSSDTQWLSGEYGWPLLPDVGQRGNDRCGRHEDHRSEAARSPAPIAPAARLNANPPRRSRPRRTRVPRGRRAAARRRPSPRIPGTLRRRSPCSAPSTPGATRGGAPGASRAVRPCSRDRAAARAEPRPSGRAARRRASPAPRASAADRTRSTGRPRPRSGDQLGHPAVVAEAAVIGRDHVLDLVGQQRAGIDLGRRRGAEEHHHRAAGGERLVGQRPNTGHAQAARDEQHVACPGVDLEAAPERPEHLGRLAGLHPRRATPCPRRSPGSGW